MDKSTLDDLRQKEAAAVCIIALNVAFIMGCMEHEKAKPRPSDSMQPAQGFSVNRGTTRTVGR